MMVAVEEVAIPDIDVNRVVLSDDAPGGAAVIEIATPEPAEDFPRQELRPLADFHAFGRAETKG
jgi:hypothetical protein